MAKLDDSAGLPIGFRAVGGVSVVLGVATANLTWQRNLLSGLLGRGPGLLDYVPFLLLGLLLACSGSNLLVSSSAAWRWARLGFFLSAPGLLVLGLAFCFRALQASGEEPTESTTRIVAEFPWGVLWRCSGQPLLLSPLVASEGI
jgi:hypothetical protein